MSELKIGDVVGRKSYGCDIPFRVMDIRTENGKTIYVLKGLSYRIEADCEGDDLIQQDISRFKVETVNPPSRSSMRRYPLVGILSRWRIRAGKILHLDSSAEFLDMCKKEYDKARIPYVGKVIAESEQPRAVRKLLEEVKPDILVLTGHDGIKKNAGDLLNINNYKNSRYYIQSVKEAREYEPSMDKMCIFSGACQSYYEGIMGAGANFASAPERVLINALDPAMVAKKIANTDSRIILPAASVIRLTITGSKGIGGVDTRGHMGKI